MNTVELLATIGFFALGLFHSVLMMFFPLRWAALPRLLAFRGYAGVPAFTIRIAGFALLLVVACFGAGAAGFRVGPITSTRPIDWMWALMAFMGIGGRGLGLSLEPGRNRFVRLAGVCLLAISPLLGYGVFVAWHGRFS